MRIPPNPLTEGSARVGRSRAAEGGPGGRGGRPARGSVPSAVRWEGPRLQTPPTAAAGTSHGRAEVEVRLTPGAAAAWQACAGARAAAGQAPLPAPM